MIRDELRKIGLQVDVSPLEGNALVQRFLSGKGYDAAYFRVGTSDTDPALNPDYWFSSGGSHVWNLAQPTPATEWERRIDALMLAQSTSLDEAERKRLFDEVQRIFAEHVPVVHFVAPQSIRGGFDARPESHARRSAARSCCGPPTRWGCSRCSHTSCGGWRSRCSSCSPCRPRRWC